MTKIIPGSFGVIWFRAGEHFVGIYATWVNNSGGVMQVLLACGVPDIPTDAAEINEIGFTAEDIGDNLCNVLRRYNKGFDCIEFIVGDNASVDRLLANPNRIKEWPLKTKNIRRTVQLIG